MIDICSKIHHNGKCGISDSSDFFFNGKKIKRGFFFFESVIELFLKKKSKQYNKFMSRLALKELAVQQGRSELS